MTLPDSFLDFRVRVYHCARAVAQSYFRHPYRDATIASRRFAVQILNAPQSDLKFTDLAGRVMDQGVGTDEELTKALEAVWEQAAADFDPRVDGTA